MPVRKQPGPIAGPASDVQDPARPRMRCGELVPREVKLERFTTPDIIGHDVLGHEALAAIAVQ